MCMKRGMTQTKWNLTGEEWERDTDHLHGNHPHWTEGEEVSLKYDSSPLHTPCLHILKTLHIKIKQTVQREY